jgi:hypothetical protein
MDSSLIEVGRMSAFLSARLTEDLSRIWARDAASTDPERRPGMAAQVAVVHDVLAVLESGRLPERRELRLLLWGYAAHPDYDPQWVLVLNG